jgi:hypothetical protein
MAMKRVLLVGLDPATVDYSDPALPPGMTAEKIHAGIKLGLADMAARGWLAENCFINPNETAVPTVERRLADGRYDCVVVGAGVRLHRAGWRCSKQLSTPSTAARRKRPSPSTAVPRILARRLPAGSESCGAYFVTAFRPLSTITIGKGCNFRLLRCFPARSMT